VAYKIPFSEAKRDYALREVINSSTDSKEFKAQVNEAQRMLLRRGSWFGTEVLVDIKVHESCITWPRQVGTIEGVNLGRHSDGTNVQNNWYSILHRGFSHHHGCHEQGVLQDIGFGVTYRDITGCPGSLIYAFAFKPEDWGKKLTIYGRDFQGQPLMEKVNGAWQQGLTLTLGNTIQGQFVSTPFAILNPIQSVVKDITAGNVMLYEYDPVSQTMRDIALFEPGETTPRYRKSKLGAHCFFNNVSNQNGSNGENRCNVIQALVKLAFVPVIADNDFLMIDNLEAIALAVQSLRYARAGDVPNKDAYLAEAIRELNAELRTAFPNGSTVIVSNPVGRQIRSLF
jgi:hypothetical protein